MLLLYLRPLFVRSAVGDLNFSHNEIGLTPQIGFKDKHICHVAMSLLHELNESQCGRAALRRLPGHWARNPTRKALQFLERRPYRPWRNGATQVMKGHRTNRSSSF